MTCTICDQICQRIFHTHNIRTKFHHHFWPQKEINNSTCVYYRHMLNGLLLLKIVSGVLISDIHECSGGLKWSCWDLTDSRSAGLQYDLSVILVIDLATFCGNQSARRPQLAASKLKNVVKPPLCGFLPPLYI